MFKVYKNPKPSGHRVAKGPRPAKSRLLPMAEQRGLRTHSDTDDNQLKGSRVSGLILGLGFRVSGLILGLWFRV